MSLQGLSQEEARQRLIRDGPNELPSAKRRSFLQLLVEVLREPMTSLLAACGLVYALIGDRQEAFMLMVFWALIIFITLYQQRKTESALAALKRLSSPRALVIRSGEKIRISGAELVVDDILILNEGDIVPADAELAEAFQVQIDESLLTGESFSVDKEINSLVWAGTTVVRGQLLGKVIATGARTKLGKIGKLLETGRSDVTALNLETRKVVKYLTLVAVILCILTSTAYALASKDYLAGILVGLTLAMAILPNELPAVLTIFLALGTRRISQRNVLTRRLAAVENIGATTTLCVDKTGTLTLNKMMVQEVVSLSKDQQSEQEVLKFAILASNQNSFDPMERAIMESGGLGQTLEPPAFQFPLSPYFFAMSNFRIEKDFGGYEVASKGAPEAILKICKLSEARAQEVLRQVGFLAEKGLRVLAVAKGLYSENEFPKIHTDLRLQYLGLIGLADPVRPGVKESIQLCYDAGIRVIMITGDHAKTASAIAEQIGLKESLSVLRGSDMEAMSDQELKEKLKTTNCFARMIPEQKLRIVKLLQEQGEVVTMTGDGVNDAPALMAAQIGIAMGRKGTDVARESASMVLLDDDFTSIVQGIRVGRGIYDNLQSAVAYLLAIHLPIAGISMLPVFLNLPLVLMPVHIVFLHLIIEPACSLVFEAEPLSKDVMKRPPRNMADKFFSKKLILPSLLQGLVVYFMILLVFLVSLSRGQGEQDARALTFTTLIFANLGLIFINRSWHRRFWDEFEFENKAQWWMTAVSLIILFLVLYVPALRTLFRFSILHPLDITISFSAALLSIGWFEFWKFLRRTKK